MVLKKRYFTRNKEKVFKSVQDRTSKRANLGNKSVNPRESVRSTQLAQDKKEMKKVDLSLRAKRGNLVPVGFPNISQTITDPLNSLRNWRTLGLLIFFLCLLGVSIWQGVLLTQKGIVLQSILSQRIVLSEQMALWEAVAQKYPTYRDAYFQAAVLAYRLGDREREQQLLDKALQLDPNYAPAQKLENLR